MDTMIQIAENIKGKIIFICPETVPPGIVGQICNVVDLELTGDPQPCDTAKCRLMEVDFQEGWVKLHVPNYIIEKGFHGGSVLVDFSGVQE